MKEKEYQFPPQIGQAHIYFGYRGWELVMIAFFGVISLYLFIQMQNIFIMLPVTMFSLLCCKPNNRQSIFQVLKRAYNYFIAKPITYDYLEVKNENDSKNIGK